MATLDFPTSPALNDTYSFGGKTWVWNGQGWQLQTQGAINGLIIGNSTPAAGTFTVLSATGNVTGGNVLISGLVSATGNVTGNYILGNGALLTGVITSVSNINSGTSNVTVVSSGGNVTVGVGGTSNVAVFATTGEYVTGVLSASGNVTGGNLLTSGLISATANVTGGNILTSGIVSSTGNIIANAKLLVGTATTTLTNPVAVFTGSGSTYSQLSMQNPTGTGSADITVYGNNGDDNQSWTDMGFTGNTFNDTNYTITKAGDGYLFAQGNTSFGGNLVIATGNTGTTRDIVFSYGFLAANEFLRFSRSGNAIIPYGNATANIGNTTNQFNTVFAKATSAQYADLAEYYKPDADYSPGTVVVFGGHEEITISNKSHDTRVAGVISTEPAYVMNSSCPGLPVALTGRVPCRVQGPVTKGDVLVTSELPGVAQRIGMIYQPGCVLGKSLEEISDNSVAVIEVVVGRF